MAIKNFNKRSSERGACLMRRLLLLLLTVSSVPFALTQQQCSWEGNSYQHADVFVKPGNYPCTKHTCSNGQIKLFEEGCHYKQICRPIDTTFRDKCESHSCSKTFVNGQPKYTTKFVSAYCEDYYGQCYHPGGKFTYLMDSQLRRRCTCHRKPDGTVEYTCP